MGDDVVSEVMEEWDDLAVANGLDYGRLRPIADSVVNRLREFGMSDEDILAALSQGEHRHDH